MVLCQRKKMEWYPNHFVPLVTMDSPTVKADRVEDADPLFTSSDGARHMEADDAQNTTEGTENEFSPDLSTVQEEGENITLTNSDPHEERESVSVDTSDIHEERENVNVNNTDDSENNLDNSSDNLVNASNETVSDSDTEDAPEFTRGPLSKFMDLTAITNIFKGPHTVIQEVPAGWKDGMFFVVDNTANQEKRANGMKSEFWDDGGAWVKGTSPSTIFIERDGKLLSRVKRQGVYCTLKQSKNKREFIPLQTQPDEGSLIIVHRNYQTLKVSPSGTEQFRKRITWFEKSSDSLPSVSDTIAVVEYIGTFPGRAYHGLVKDENKNVKYYRTKQEVRERLEKQVENRPAKGVERENNTNIKCDFDKQRNEKQLRNMKYKLSSKDTCKNANNLADQIINVEKLTKSHPFVQSVRHVKNMNFPLVTLYTPQQIHDIKRFCCHDNGCVLGVDKTYNLGEFHVTPTVYKDQSVLQRATGDHPICFGPTLIHQTSTTKAYSSFFHDIAENLTQTQIKHLTVGSDEELPFKNAFEQSLNGCTHVLCTRHLRQNSNKYMEDVVGIPKKDRSEILESIYGVNGLLEKTDIDTYTARVNNVRSLIREKDVLTSDKTFINYFENKLRPLLETHLIEPVKDGKIPPTWTNNNCESANHVLKSAIQWKQCDMPKFISKMYEIVNGDQEERCRALRDMCNFRLAERFSHNAVDIDRWSSMQEDQRERKTKRFLSDYGRSKPNEVLSTDGSRTALKTPTAGRKPCQTKRKRAERSRTPAKSAKRRL